MWHECEGRSRPGFDNRSIGKAKCRGSNKPSAAWQAVVRHVHRMLIHRHMVRPNSFRFKAEECKPMAQFRISSFPSTFVQDGASIYVSWDPPFHSRRENLPLARHWWRKRFRPKSWLHQQTWLLLQTFLSNFLPLAKSQILSTLRIGGLPFSSFVRSLLA